MPEIDERRIREAMEKHKLTLEMKSPKILFVPGFTLTFLLFEMSEV